MEVAKSALFRARFVAIAVPHAAIGSPSSARGERGPKSGRYASRIRPASCGGADRGARRPPVRRRVARAASRPRPQRPILDLAATLQAAHLESVLDRNEILELTDYPSLAALARAHPGHNGSHKLLATLQAHDAGANLTRSGLEVLFRQLCHDHGLPQPRVNTTVAGKEVDFLFDQARLIVETDSWRYHRTRRAFEDDRARDVLTTNAGYRTLRFTDRQLTDDPHSVAAAIRATLRS